MKKLTGALLLTGLICVPTLSQADTSPASPAAAAPSGPLDGIDFSGHVDIGYTKLNGFGRFINGINYQQF